MLDIGSTLENVSLLLGINATIIPTVITLFVILILIFLTFKMQLSGLLSTGILIAMYTLAMSILAFLNINSSLNIITLLGNLL